MKLLFVLLIQEKSVECMNETNKTEWIEQSISMALVEKPVKEINKSHTFHLRLMLLKRKILTWKNAKISKWIYEYIFKEENDIRNTIQKKTTK